MESSRIEKEKEIRASSGPSDGRAPHPERLEPLLEAHTHALALPFATGIVEYPALPLSARGMARAGPGHSVRMACAERAVPDRRGGRGRAEDAVGRAKGDGRQMRGR
jgi:hypothetical protein